MSSLLSWIYLHYIITTIIGVINNINALAGYKTFKRLWEVPKKFHMFPKESLIKESLFFNSS